MNKDNDMASENPEYNDMLYGKGMNSQAMAMSLSHLDMSRGFLDDWKEVKCNDDTKALVLKHPEDAFELYAKEWSSKFSVLIDLLNQAKVEGNSEVNNKIVKLFDNLNYVDAALREMYKSAYLTFAAAPCSEKAQDEKRAMDRIIVATSLTLVALKLRIESGDGANNLDTLNSEIMKLIEKITTMIMPK
jgi:hypothetical protein